MCGTLELLLPGTHSHPPRLDNFVVQAQEFSLSSNLQLFVIEFFKSVETSFNVGGLLSLQMLTLLNFNRCLYTIQTLFYRGVASDSIHLHVHWATYTENRRWLEITLLLITSNHRSLDRVSKSAQRTKVNHQTTSCLLHKSKIEMKSSGVRIN